MSDYTGPVAGYTNEEMAEVLGWAVLDCLEKEGMEIIWKRKV